MRSCNLWSRLPTYQRLNGGELTPVNILSPVPYTGCTSFGFSFSISRRVTTDSCSLAPGP